MAKAVSARSATILIVSTKCFFGPRKLLESLGGRQLSQCQMRGHLLALLLEGCHFFFQRFNGLPQLGLAALNSSATPTSSGPANSAAPYSARRRVNCAACF